MESLKKIIRNIPDFPKKGILFKDITTLLSDAKSFQTTVDLIGHRYTGKRIDAVVGIEARGFIFGAAVAYKLGAGFVIVRKPGKLPYKTRRMKYDLEYGSDSLEIHEDAIKKGQKVLIVDDLLATGGTVSAVSKLVEQQGGKIIEIAFLCELEELNGRSKLTPHPVFSLIKF